MKILILRLMLLIIFFSVNLFAEENIQNTQTKKYDYAFELNPTAAEWTGGIIGLGLGYGILYLYNLNHPMDGTYNTGYLLMPCMISAGVIIGGAKNSDEGSYLYSGAGSYLGCIAGNAIALVMLSAILFKYPMNGDKDAPDYLLYTVDSLIYIVAPAMELVLSVFGYNAGKKRITSDVLLSVAGSSVTFGIPSFGVITKTGYSINETVIFAKLIEIRF